MAAVSSAGAAQTSALKISTSAQPSYPAPRTAAVIGGKSMKPSPMCPRPSSMSAGSGRIQSHSW
jgi:hypothetical protein